MTVKEWLAVMDSGAEITDGPVRDMLCDLAELAREITVEMNRTHRGPETMRSLMRMLTAREIDDTVVVTPPFYCDCGKNLRIGKDVYINQGCLFMDQGGIVIEDGVQIGPNCTIVTLRHNHEPGKRHNMFPKPVRIGKNAILYASVTVLPGVTIGENAVVGAGSVVTRSVPPGAVVAGNPAKTVRKPD